MDDEVESALDLNASGLRTIYTLNDVLAHTTRIPHPARLQESKREVEEAALERTREVVEEEWRKREALEKMVGREQMVGVSVSRVSR